jgi:hypothetical protein
MDAVVPQVGLPAEDGGRRRPPAQGRPGVRRETPHERNGCSAVQPGAVVPGDVGHGGAAGGRSGGSGPLAPRLSYTAVRRDSPNTQGTIGTFLTYDEAVAAARDYVLRW